MKSLKGACSSKQQHVDKRLQRRVGQQTIKLIVYFSNIMEKVFESTQTTVFPKK